MRVGFIGAGNMARALARGWGDPVLCSDGGSGRAATLARELGGRAASNLEVAREAELVVLCHKPYQLSAVAAEIAGEARAVASVLGGTPLSDVRAVYPETPVLRLMPNTPVEVRRGVVLHAISEDVEPELERQVLALFGRIGWVAAIDERLIEVGMALSSLGPAYLSLVAEAQVDAGIRYGLHSDLAGRLMAETMAGTAELLGAREYDTLGLRREVTSPGGSTARGLDALERGGVRAAFQSAIDRVAG